MILNWLIAFLLLLVFGVRISFHEAVILVTKMNGINNIRSIKKAGELNSGKLDAIGGVFGVFSAWLGLVLAEAMVSVSHAFWRCIFIVSSSFSVPLNPP